MNQSVYDLITELCEKHINKRKCIEQGIEIKSVLRKYRSKSFEILLKKRYMPECENNELKGNTDCICHLLAWQYSLRNNLNQPDKAEVLGKMINELENSKILVDPITHNIILCLLYLKGSKSIYTESHNLKYDDIFKKVTLKHKISGTNSVLPYDIFPADRFILPDSYFTGPGPDHCLSTFSSYSFNSVPNTALKLNNPSLKYLKTSKSGAKALSYNTSFNFKPLSLQTRVPAKKDFNRGDTRSDEGYDSPVKEIYLENIWDVASKLSISSRRTWESLDQMNPLKETPFACESGPKTLHKLQKVINVNTIDYINHQTHLRSEEMIISQEYFIKCLKYMLVGTSSNVFQTTEQDLFYLKNDITIEGLSIQALQSFCRDLTFCGSIYRCLNKLCSSGNIIKNNDVHGYVFKELCESIKRYLAYYRVAALTVSESSSLLKIHSHLKPLTAQLDVLARICRVSIYSEEKILQGAELLNYVYQEIIKSVDNKITLVLYSVFYPCCQIYFSRFLQRWLFEGVLIDPYEEFIVKTDTNYSHLRARIYWTRAFSLRQNSVPEFLSELKNDILQCGKAMHLLKMCNPDASLYTHIMSRPLPLISCCLTPSHSEKLKQEIDIYYVEMASMCGPSISLFHSLRDRYGHQEDSDFLNLIEKKRALHFKEMELKKQHAAEETAKRKRKIFEEMRQQMIEAVEYKKKVKEEELKQDLVFAQQNAQLEELRSQLVKQESKLLINYYDNLIEAVDKRRSSIELRKQKLLDQSLNLITSDEKIDQSCDSKSEVSSSEDILFVSPRSNFSDTAGNFDEENKNSEEVNKKEETNCPPDVSKNLDLVNANVSNIKTEPNDEKVKLYNQLNENILAAKRNRAKILNLEFNLNLTPEKSKILHKDKSKPQESREDLTEAQRNRLKVLSSEFDIFYDASNDDMSGKKKNNDVIAQVTLEAGVTRPAIILTNEENINNNTSNEPTKIDSNFASPGHENVMNLLHRRAALKLPRTPDMPTIFEKEKNSNRIQTEVIPMSVDSTPNTEYSLDLPTPSSTRMSLNTDMGLDINPDSALLTANSQCTDDGFKFPINEKKKFAYDAEVRLIFANKTKICSITQSIPKSIQPMRISKDKLLSIKDGNLKSLLYSSVYVPLAAQMKLVNSEILKYFINDQHFFSHLNSLRSYYFFMDGEFGRNITESLFTKLYNAKNPSDLLNLRALQLIIDCAIYSSSKTQENGDRLSFIVKNVPKTFDLNNSDVFECLSLSYRITWPLNILFPFDTIEKYDIIFKYLLKLHYVSFVQQKIYEELKNSRKEYGIDERVLSNSPQYHKIQMYRHIMTHFVQTLQNYTVSEVLQTSWEELENNLQIVQTLDQLYTVHTVYVKTIMFRCLLNKKCAPIMKVIREIFIVIIKFYNYLRSRSWNLKENEIYYTHPNFKKLEDIFNKFQEFTNFVFRVGNKLARVGYQPHLIQMLDMLNVNDYYTDMQKSIYV